MGRRDTYTSGVTFGEERLFAWRATGGRAAHRVSGGPVLRQTDTRSCATYTSPPARDVPARAGQEKGGTTISMIQCLEKSAAEGSDVKGASTLAARAGRGREEVVGGDNGVRIGQWWWCWWSVVCLQ